MTEQSLQHEAEIVKIGVPNKNGHIYPLDAAEAMVDQWSKRPSPFLGEFGMGEGGNVDLSRVSHVVSDLRVQDGSVVATIKFLKTPMGNVLAELAKNNITLDYRTRGYANVSNDGVISDFQLASIDAVSDGA